MHAVFALLCFLVVIHWLIFPYPSGLLHWHCGNLTIAPVPAKQPWWIWINTSCEFIMNDCITTTKQSTTKPCAYFLGYTVWVAKMYNPGTWHDMTWHDMTWHNIKFIDTSSIQQLRVYIVNETCVIQGWVNLDDVPFTVRIKFAREQQNTTKKWKRAYQI